MIKSKLKEIAGEIPVEDVEVDGGACVAEVAEVVGGDAAHVHAHVPRLVRLEDLFLLCHRVVNSKFLFLRHLSLSLSLCSVMK